MTTFTGVTGSMQLTTRVGDAVYSHSFGCFSRIKKMLGRIETRTRDRIYCCEAWISYVPVLETH